MAHTKRHATHRPHPIDQRHSVIGKKIFSISILPESATYHSVHTTHHNNPHAAFSPRTTLSKGRGK